MFPVDQIFLALDVPTIEQAEQLLRETKPIYRLKIGYELFIGAGLSYVDNLIHRGYDIFLDLKLHDIPETINRTIYLLKDHGITFLSINGNDRTIDAAIEGRGSQQYPKLLYVTQLTNTAEYTSLIIQESLAYARIITAKRHNTDGVICASKFNAKVKQNFPQAIIVNPGIRLDTAKDDHNSPVTPYEAIRAGADYLVIGRPIRDAPDRQKALQAIIKDMERKAEDNPWTYIYF